MRLKVHSTDALSTSRTVQAGAGPAEFGGPTAVQSGPAVECQAHVEPAPACPLSVTVVPRGNWAEQIVPQLIPAGSLVTHPIPVPTLETVSVT
jgi:hypothetical protein